MIELPTNAPDHIIGFLMEQAAIEGHSDTQWVANDILTRAADATGHEDTVRFLAEQSEAEGHGDQGKVFLASLELALYAAGLTVRMG